ncbi:ATP-binding protein, partial [Actinocorallia lasiicapitis]
MAGREHLWTELVAELDRAMDEGAVVVALVGDPGMGKTHLLAALRREVAERGLTARSWRASPGPHGWWSELLGCAEPEELDPGPTAGAVRSRLRDGDVLLLDDVHRADRRSARVLVELVRGGGPARLTVLAFRPDQVRPDLLQALDGAAVPTLRLEPLDEEEARSLLDPPLSEEETQRALEAAQGVPRYLEALARLGPDRPVPPAHDPLVSIVRSEFAGLDAGTAEVALGA